MTIHQVPPPHRPNPDAPPERLPFARRFRRNRQRKIVPFRRIVPSAITTCSLCAGLASIHFSLTGKFDPALLAVAISAVFDAFDGLAARILKAQSRFGAVLDSLADLVCFGVAPALLLHEWMHAMDKGSDPAWSLAALLVFVLCSALRLARFTAAPRKPKGNPAMSKFFTGMPTPAAAACALIPPMIEQSRLFNARFPQFDVPAWLIVANTFLIACLMISRIPMFALKHVRVKPRHVPFLLVFLGLLVVGITRDAWLVLAALSAGYLLTIPLSWLAYAKAKAKTTALSPPLAA